MMNNKELTKKIEEYMPGRVIACQVQPGAGEQDRYPCVFVRTELEGVGERSFLLRIDRVGIEEDRSGFFYDLVEGLHWVCESDPHILRKPSDLYLTGFLAEIDLPSPNATAWVRPGNCGQPWEVMNVLDESTSWSPLNEFGGAAGGALDFHGQTMWVGFPQDGFAIDGTISIGLHNLDMGDRTTLRNRARMKRMSNALAGSEPRELLDEILRAFDRHSRDDIADMMRKLAGQGR